jgi:hypothetical protein
MLPQCGIRPSSQSLGPGGALTPPGLAPKECTFDARETVSAWSGRLAADDQVCALLGAWTEEADMGSGKNARSAKYRAFGRVVTMRPDRGRFEGDAFGDALCDAFCDAVRPHHPLGAYRLQIAATSAREKV